MMTRIGAVQFSLLVTLALAHSHSAWAQAQAQAQVDPDWPCIQRYVPEISAATIWGGPPVHNFQGVWSERPRIHDLVAGLTARRTGPEQAERDITTFAGTLPGGEKKAVLTSLFAGVLEAVNDKRRVMIKRIREYARQQRVRVDRIEIKLIEFDRIKENTSPVDRAKAEELRQELEMATRIFEDRERSISALCELPVKLESTLGALTRVISSHLD
ncbi:MAG: hypothetical protein AAEC10_06500 [Rhodospirillales bacterium]